MPGPAIETQELVREFKKGPRAVDGIDLRVEPGEVYGFLGPNGAGKSTAVHMLTTLLPPTSGRAWVAGHDVVEEGSEVRATIGAALQEAALDPYLTGREHMKLQTALHGMARAEARERADALLERVGLVQEADVLADRVGIIDHGRIVAEGTPEELKGEIGRPSVEAIPQDPAELEHMKDVLSRFGESVAGSPKGASVRLAGGDAQLAEVVRALDSENIEIQELQLHAPTLDDVFLAKTGRSLEGESGAEPEPEPEPASA